MRNIVGKPVIGADFFGRERELQSLIEAVRNQHVLLLAPRRVGKTSLLFALASHFQTSKEMHATYVSVAAAQDEAEFVRLVFQAIYDTPAGKRLRPNLMARWLSRRRQRIKKLGAAGASIELEPIERPWQPAADEAFARLRASQRPWLLMIDEVPNLVLALAKKDPTGVRVQTFLQWFRNLRQQISGEDQLRFVLAGSIGLDSVTRRYHLSATINDLRDWRLGAYDPATADRFLSALSTSYKLQLPVELRGLIVREAEWCIPYHLQLVFSELQQRVRDRPASEGDLTSVLDELLAKKVYFSTWEERLADTFGAPEGDLAKILLTKCAAKIEGATQTTLESALAKHLIEPTARKETLRWLLDALGHDGYLVAEQGRWRFRSGLLRRYWQRNCA